MLKRRVAILALTLAVASTVGMVPSGMAEEMVVDSDKVYTPGKHNGVDGYWVEFKRKRYLKNENYISNPVGRYDATIQEAFASITGLNRALSPSEMEKIYKDYGIPKATTKNYDYAAYHDFNWTNTLTKIRADLTGGKLTASKVPTQAVEMMSKLINSKDTVGLIDMVGGSAIDASIKKAFEANGGGMYTYNNSDGYHTLSYTHGQKYINPDQFDQATYNQVKNRSVQDLLVNSPSDFKKLVGLGNLDSLVQAGRFTAMAELIDSGVNPFGMEIDTWVNTVNGPVHIVEPQPTAQRLRDLSRWLVASEWTTHSPIVLDLNHDGRIGVTGSSTAQKRLRENAFVPAGAVWFDIMANGKKQRIEWLNGDGDGFLVDDTNGRVSKAAAGNGVINAQALFGDAIGYTNGYHKLAYKATKINLASVFQSDSQTNWSTLYRKQPVLKGKVLDNLKVWVDTNRDALVQPKELRTLASLGITEIGSKPTISKNKQGEYVIQSYFIQKGKRYMTEDVWFAEDPATLGK